MSVRQLYFLLVAVFAAIVLASGVWEFWLEAHLRDYFGHHPNGQGWDYILAIIISSLIALCITATIARRTIVSTKQMHTTFNETLVSLEERVRSRTDELEKTVEMLKAENNRRTQMEQELKQVRETAEQASQAKSVFLSCVSHELYTPMNAIMGFTTLLREDLKDRLTETQVEYLDEIYSSSWRLLRMIDKMLKLSMLDTDDLEVAIEEVNLCEEVNECLTLVKTLAAEKYIEINIDGMPECKQTVMADKRYLPQVIYNLITNAIRYNKDRGDLCLWCNRVPGGNRLRFNVRDSGQGMSREKLADIFTPFSWKTLSDFSTGSGIGLTVTKQLIELMGGAIGVNSTTDKGSHFWIDLDMAHIPA